MLQVNNNLQTVYFIIYLLKEIMEAYKADFSVQIVNLDVPIKLQ